MTEREAYTQGRKAGLAGTPANKLVMPRDRQLRATFIVGVVDGIRAGGERALRVTVRSASAR